MIQVMLRFSIYFYHLPTKLWEDNVFSCVYLSVSLSIRKWSPHLTIIHVSHRSHETLALDPRHVQTCSTYTSPYPWDMWDWLESGRLAFGGNAFLRSLWSRLSVIFIFIVYFFYIRQINFLTNINKRVRCILLEIFPQMTIEKLNQYYLSISKGCILYFTKWKKTTHSLIVMGLKNYSHTMKSRFFVMPGQLRNHSRQLIFDCLLQN